MEYRALIWSIYILPSITAIHIPTIKPNATDPFIGKKTFEELTEEAIDLFAEWETLKVLNRSYFQYIRVWRTYNVQIPLTSGLDLDENIELNFEVKNPADDKYLWDISYFIDGFEPARDSTSSPHTPNYPVWNYPDDLRGTTFADALKLLTDHYGLDFFECTVLKPPKDPFREGQHPLEVMWACCTQTDRPLDRIYVVTTSLAVWGNFTSDDLGLLYASPPERPPCDSLAERAAGNTTHVKGNLDCKVSTS